MRKRLTGFAVRHAVYYSFLRIIYGFLICNSLFFAIFQHTRVWQFMNIQFLYFNNRNLVAISCIVMHITVNYKLFIL